jgi:hypothetical protein
MVDFTQIVNPQILGGDLSTRVCESLTVVKSPHSRSGFFQKEIPEGPFLKKRPIYIING